MKRPCFKRNDARDGIRSNCRPFDFPAAGTNVGLVRRVQNLRICDCAHLSAGDRGVPDRETPERVLVTASVHACFTDGHYPYAGLIQASDGNFYGTTVYGGTHAVRAVFQITPEGKLTTVRNFC
jgi:hypothetical protein